MSEMDRVASDQQGTENVANPCIPEGFGLVKGIDPDTSENYTPELDMTNQGLAFFTGRGVLWAAALADANDDDLLADQCLKTTIENFDKFFASPFVPDRTGIKHKLKEVMTEGGNIAALLGGEKVGKTMLLQDLWKSCKDEGEERKEEVVQQDEYEKDQQEDQRHSSLDLLLNFFNCQGTEEDQVLKPIVFFIDAKVCMANEAEGLKVALEDVQKEYFAKKAFMEKVGLGCLEMLEKLLVLLQVLSSCYGGLTEPSTQIELVVNQIHKLCPSPPESKPPLVHLVIEKFVEFAKSQGRHPVVIVDQASDTFDNSSKTCNILADGDSGGRIIQKILLDIISFTKQRKEVSAIFALSPSGSLYQSKNPSQFELVTNVVMRDMSPKDTCQFLENATNPQTGSMTIGMGPKLTKVCVGAYGGRLARIYEALNLLRERKGAFRGDALIHVGMGETISNCLKIEAQEDLLKTMALRGFVAINSIDESVRNIAELNLGCVVKQSTFLEEKTPDGWVNTNDQTKESDMLLIPSNQELRLCIAKKLMQRQ